MNKDFDEHVAASVEYIKANVPTLPSIGVILGSGLGDFGDLLAGKISLETKNIPHYPVSSVEGHAGRLLFGKLKSAERDSADLLVFQGRIHFYESNSTDVVVYPIEVARQLGIKKLVVTNAAGGVNRHFAPGDLMIISDYINLTFENPLISGANDTVRTYRPGFSQNLIALARRAASEENIPVKEGVYCWTKGPSYE
jgi:purine-nucleoside phosphorylase